MNYFFILGKHPELSKIEIFALLSRKSIDYEVIKYSAEVLVLNITQNSKSSNQFHAKDFLYNLGGTIKIGLILEEKVDVKHFEDLIPTMSSYLKSELSVKQKIKFGFSTYLLRAKLHKQAEYFLYKSIKKLGISVKNTLREGGDSSSFMVSKEAALSSVYVTKNRLLTLGADFCFFILNNKKVMVGRTLAVQDYDFYSKIDYGRPARNSKSGMLPPKLAKIMVNISGASSRGSIYDPFCGSGMVLQQALLLGYNQVSGSDKSERAVQDTEENLSWIMKIFKLAGSKIKVFQAPVAGVERNFKERSIDAVVTEPFLGPPLQGFEKEDVLNKTIDELTVLYTLAFETFKKLLKKDGHIVMVIPAFIFGDTKLYIPIDEMLLKNGFEVERKFEDNVLYSKRGALEYGRKDQHLVREIFVIKQKKQPTLES